MTSFTTFVHVTGSARNMGDDLPHLQKIIETVYANHAMVAHEWVEPALSRQKSGAQDKEVNWSAISDENITAIERADMVIIEATQSRFSQGFQAYNAAQRKKPTLVLTRSEIKNRYISGVGNKYLQVKQYSSQDELASIVSKFIKQNTIPEKNLRLNIVLDRHIYKYLRDRSYHTGMNKSEIVRAILEKNIEKRN